MPPQRIARRPTHRSSFPDRADDLPGGSRSRSPVTRPAWSPSSAGIPTRLPRAWSAPGHRGPGDTLRQRRSPRGGCATRTRELPRSAAVCRAGGCALASSAGREPHEGLRHGTSRGRTRKASGGAVLLTIGPAGPTHKCPIDGPNRARVGGVGGVEGDAVAGVPRDASWLTWRRTTVGGRSALYGEAGEGPPVLFLHGWGLDHKVYKRALSRLAAAGVHVLAPAMPGFGGTPSLPRESTSLTGYADWSE